MIFLVVFRDDDGLEIVSAWSTKDRADAEIKRILDSKEGPSFYWHSNRLDVVSVPIDVQAEPL